MSSEKKTIMAPSDWETWKNDSSKFHPGDLVKIIYQPFFEDRGIIGKVGVVIKKTESINYIRYLYWDVLVDNKLYPVHYRNMTHVKDSIEEPE